MQKDNMKTIKCIHSVCDDNGICKMCKESAFIDIQQTTTREDIENILSEMDNEDETLPLLERAFNHYCGVWDKCEAYKDGIRATLADQYDNHSEEQDPNDLNQLSDILNGAI